VNKEEHRYDMAAKKRSRVIVYGNDLYREIITPNAKGAITLTYWDLWISIILVNEFDSDWDKMVDYFRSKKKGYSFQRDGAEALINHLHMLRQMFVQSELCVDNILAESDVSFLKKQKIKAKRKILEMGFQNKEKSTWMIHTPKKRREAKAMRGYWDRFPISPHNYSKLLNNFYKSSGYSKNQSFSLEEKLSSFIENLEVRVSQTELFALYRAFLTVVVETMNLVDDSYGVIGDLYMEIFRKYFQFDRKELDMHPEDFFQDLIELLIWEDYGGTTDEQPNFFAGLTSAELSLVESILQKQRDELCELEIEYQAEKALTMLGMLYVQHQLFDKFVPTAKIMGTRVWERITTMSEMAEIHQKYDIALAVYEACLGPGSHEDFLRKKYKKLKGRHGQPS
jgi:hypothetical protein